jgi:hypothetical protein
MIAFFTRTRFGTGFAMSLLGAMIIAAMPSIRW